MEKLFTEILAGEGLRLLGWRDVPVKSNQIGAQARTTEPFIRQIFIARDALNEAQFERKLYMVRKRVEKAAAESAIQGLRTLLRIQFVGPLPSSIRDCCCRIKWRPTTRTSPMNGW